jgi:hypothetical protein
MLRSLHLWPWGYLALLLIGAMLWLTRKKTL